MSLFRIAIFGIIALTAAIPGASGLEPVVLTGDQGVYRLGKRLELLEDASGLLEVSDVRGLSNWKPSTRTMPNLGLTKSVYWARFALEDRSNGVPHILELEFPSMDSITLFLPANDSFLIRESGDLLPFQTREIPRRTFCFSLPSGIAGTVYMRFQTRATMVLPLTIRSTKAFLVHGSKEQLFFGFFWGMLASLLLYNLFLLFSLRDPAYFFYVLYVLFFFFFQLSEDGFAFQFLWPDSPEWANRAGPVFLSGTLFSILGFTRSFTSMHTNAPALDKSLLGATGALVLLGVLAFTMDYRFVIAAEGVLVFVSALLVAAAGVRALIEGYSPARWFAAAWAVLITTSVAADLETGGLLPSFFFSIYAVKAGAVIELVLLSLALADRINALKDEQRLLMELATTDSKTRISNYRHFDYVLQQEIKRSLRYRRPLSLIMIDVDDFKKINDEFGHKAGDEVLRSTAALLAENCREADLVARFGGDEFVVILPETSLDSGIETAAKLRSLVEGMTVSHEGVDLAITISLGVASVPAHARERNGLVAAADKALYLAKETGKNQVKAFPALAT